MYKYVIFFALVAMAWAQPVEDGYAQIKYLNTDVNQHGFDYSYETTNDIRASAKGDEHGNIQGNFGWVSPEGEHIALSYVADENGYQPSGDILPTPPPIPAAILKALEYIRTHPAYVERSGH